MVILTDLVVFQACEDSAKLEYSKYEQVQFLANVDDLYLDIVSPPSPFQTFYGDREETREVSSHKPQQSGEKSYAIPSASLEILRNSYTSKVQGKVDGKKLHSDSLSSLSTNEMIEIAALNFIKSKSDYASRDGDELSSLSHPYASAFLGLSSKNSADVQLLQDLLSCAERVSNQQYLSASKLLAGCYKLSYNQENAIRRLVYYFAEALCDKVDRETGRFSAKNMMKKSPLEPMTSASGVAAFHQKLPPNQIIQFAAIQQVVDHVSSSRKVHIIDIEMRCGLQQVILMQALASRNESPLKSYKITAVAMEPSLTAEKAGVRLRILAKSLNLSFSFNLIKLEDMLNLPRKFSHRDSDEKTVVYASNSLKLMIVKPNLLESLMGFIRNINPCVMIVCEPEGNVNSPVFVNRFVEALFYYGAYFDCVEDCMKNDDEDRTFVEANLLSSSLRTTVANEGEERRSRIVGINVWRAFFVKFGMVEKELSALAIDHANLVLNMFDCRDSCTLSLNGKSLIVHWKETPMCSLSAWKFHKLLSV